MASQKISTSPSPTVMGLGGPRKSAVTANTPTTAATVIAPTATVRFTPTV